MKNKLIVGLVILLVLVATTSWANPGAVRILVNGSLVEGDADAYINKQGRTMVPLRFVAEELGYDVGWCPDTRTVFIEEQKQVDGRGGVDLIPIREAVEMYSLDWQWSAIAGDGWVYKNNKRLFSWRDEGQVINGVIYLPDYVIERYK